MAVLAFHCMLAVSTETAVPIAQLRGTARKRTVAWPRQMAMALAYELSGRSLASVGLAFGGRDHSTIHHACSQVRHRCARRPATAQLYARCRARAIAEAGS